MRDASYPQPSLAFDWLMAVLSALVMAGVLQDGWAHAHGLVDQSFLTPWHAILYSCMAVAGIVLGVVGLRNVARGSSFRRALPFGYWTSLIGVVLFATGGVFDLFWHTLYGIETDITGLISVSHLWLALGGALLFVGPLRSLAHRFDAQTGGWKFTGPAIISVLAMLLLLGFFTQYASPQADSTNEQIIAPNTSGTTGGALYSVRSNGSAQTRLTVLANRDIWGAASSPSGKYIAYRVQNGVGSGVLAPSDIYVARSDGTRATRLTHSGRHDTQVAWSADSKRLAYVSMPAGTSGDFSIVTMNRDGTKSHALLTGTTTVQNPSWSPDDKWIAFQSRNGLHQQIALIPASGGAAIWLASTVGGAEPSFSRSGSLVFTKDDNTLAMTDKLGATATPLNISGSESTFSPDGKHLAYILSAGGASQVFVANLDGTHAMNATQLSGEDASHPAWISNSELVFTAAGSPRPIYTNIAKAYSEDAFIISSIVVMGLLLMLVRRWRMPAGAMTLILGLYAIALATQSDSYFDIPAAIATGIIADLLLYVLRDRARAGNGFYTFALVVPFVMCTSYVTAVRIHDGGLGWPPNMTWGSPFIAGFAGLLISFCFAPPLAPGQTTQPGKILEHHRLDTPAELEVTKR